MSVFPCRTGFLGDETQKSPKSAIEQQLDVEKQYDGQRLERESKHEKNGNKQCKYTGKQAQLESKQRSADSKMGSKYDSKLSNEIWKQHEQLLNDPKMHKKSNKIRRGRGGKKNLSKNKFTIISN